MVGCGSSGSHATSVGQLDTGGHSASGRNAGGSAALGGSTSSTASGNDAGGHTTVGSNSAGSAGVPTTSAGGAASTTASGGSTSGGSVPNFSGGSGALAGATGTISGAGGTNVGGLGNSGGGGGVTGPTAGTNGGAFQTGGVGTAGSNTGGSTAVCNPACDVPGWECIDNQCRAPKGTLLWERTYDGGHMDRVYSVASDSKGNALIGGSTRSLTPALHDDFLVRKYDPAGLLLWDHEFENADYGSLDGVITGAADEVLVLGTRANGSEDIAFLRVISSDGTLIEHREFPSAELSGLDDAAIDSHGNLLLVGGLLTDYVRTVVIKKLDPGRNELWTKTFHEGGLNYRGYDIAVTPEDDILLATGTAGDAGWVGMLDADGNQLWHDEVDLGDYDLCTGVVSDASGRVWVSGYLDQHQAWLRQYTMDGALVRDTTVRSDGAPASAISLSASGGVYLGGALYNATAKNAQAWVAEYSGAHDLLWQFQDPPGKNGHGRSVQALALTPQGDLLVAGAVMPTNYEDFWLARFAGPKGGIPEISSSVDAGVSDAGSGCRLDAGAEQVPTSLTADLVASSLSGSGTGVLGGVVHLPACVSAGTSMQVGIAVAPGPSTAWLGNEVIAATVPINTNGLRYLISGLSDGQYILFMRLDSNHDGKFGTGDYAGYVGGTVSAPILDPGASASVVVSSTQPGSASFGLGTL